MIIIKYIILMAFSAVLFNSCFPEDVAVKPYDRGDKELGQAGLGEFYTTQVYFDLGTNREVAKHSILEWDLAFTCNESQFHVYLNFARFSKVHNFGSVAFENISSEDVDLLTEDDWKFDKPDGNPDSTAIGKWWDSKSGNNISSKLEVFVINNVRDEKGLFYRKKKFQILGFVDNKFKVRLANLDGSDDSMVEFEKNPLINEIYLSLDDKGKAKSLQPPYQAWDLMFTRFTELLFEADSIPVWYSVITPLLNSKFVAATIDTSHTFDEIKLDMIDNYHLSTLRNAIGHTWKFYNLEEGKYYIYSDWNYVVKDTEGFYYKLHFTDFYSETGLKGFPKFEFIKL